MYLWEGLSEADAAFNLVTLSASETPPTKKWHRRRLPLGQLPRKPAHPL